MHQQYRAAGATAGGRESFDVFLEEEEKLASIHGIRGSVHRDPPKKLFSKTLIGRAIRHNNLFNGVSFNRSLKLHVL